MASAKPPATTPQNAAPTPARDTPLAVIKKVINAASRLLSSFMTGGANGVSPYGFSVSPSGTIIYVADDGTGIGIRRYGFSAGVWSFNYVVNPIATRGLAVDWSGANPVLYAATTVNTLIKITDVGAGSPSNVVATAAANTAFRGVALTPVAMPTAPPPPTIRFGSVVLPPPDGVYVSPQLFHLAFANGIVISNISHRKFTQSTPPPPTNGTQIHSFGSSVEVDLASGGGQVMTEQKNESIRISGRLFAPVGFCLLVAPND